VDSDHFRRLIVLAALGAVLLVLFQYSLEHIPLSVPMARHIALPAILAGLGAACALGSLVVRKAPQFLEIMAWLSLASLVSVWIFGLLTPTYFVGAEP
jgi:hypothetical protein